MLRSCAMWVLVCAPFVVALCLVAAQEPTVPTAQAQNPVAVDGARLFRDRGCSHCHGESLEGTEKAPSLQSVGLTLSREKIQTQIMKGGLQMPPFGDILSEPEVQSLADFLSAQKKAIKPSKKRGVH